MFEVDSSDIDRVAGRLEGAGRESAREAGRLLRSTAMDVETDAKRFAPVRTGTLRRSIRHEIRHTRGGAEAIVGTDVPYARRIERGFVGADALGRVYNDPPRAYMGPALDRNMPDFIAGMQRIADRGL